MGCWRELCFCCKQMALICDGICGCCGTFHEEPTKEIVLDEEEAWTMQESIASAE